MHEPAGSGAAAMGIYERGGGEGSRMMAGHSRSRSTVKVMLFVRETSTQVVDFYKHLGFEAIPRVIMQKWLEEGHN